MTVIALPDDEARGRLAPLPSGVEAVVWDGRGEAPPRAAQAEFVIAPYPGGGFDIAHFLAGLPNLRVLQLFSAGFDGWSGRLPRTAKLCNGRGIHTSSTAELAVALTVASVRGLPHYVAAQGRGVWEPLPSRELAGMRALVVGYGEIGRAVAQRLRAFEVEVTPVGRRAADGVQPIDALFDLLPAAELVIVTVPLTPATSGLVDRRFLQAMADGALLVNVSRGQVVDTDDLVAELRLGRISAALDVVEPEPLPSGHPLWEMPNVLITPHVGGGTSGWSERAYRLAREQLRRYLAGEPLRNVVEAAAEPAPDGIR
ncbi:Phosphoglycerate dehydrogenase [Frankineae bacterium MT45]|nr:Phosphoglycerate dehydrogenase [Frankineae bacterium MT45]